MTTGLSKKQNQFPTYQMAPSLALDGEAFHHDVKACMFFGICCRPCNNGLCFRIWMATKVWHVALYWSLDFLGSDLLL